MERNKIRDALIVHDAPVLFCDLDLSVEHGDAGGVPEQNNDGGFDNGKLLKKVFPSVADHFLGRRAAKRKIVHRARDEDAVLIQANIAYQRSQKLSGSSDERPAGSGFFLPRRLPKENYPRIGAALAGNSFPHAAFSAFVAAGDLRGDPGEFLFLVYHYAE